MTTPEELDEARLERLAAALIENHRMLMRKLIDQRKKYQLSQDEVALRMGVSQPTVCALERYDANPTLSTLRRYAMAVDARIVEEVLDDRVSSVEGFLAASSPRMSWAAPSAAGLTWSVERAHG